MLISTGPSTHPRHSRPSSQPSVDAGQPRDAVDLGVNGPAEIALMTFAGAVPLVGAITNFAGMIGTGSNGDQRLASASLAGAAANLLGTGSLVAGLLTGTNVATMVGLSLLGASAVVSGIATSAL